MLFMSISFANVVCGEVWAFVCDNQMKNKSQTKVQQNPTGKADELLLLELMHQVTKAHCHYLGLMSCKENLSCHVF